MSTKQVGPIQFQGKLGTIVGRATRKGTMSLGMAPTKYTNPNTDKQVIARARFLAAMAFSSNAPKRALVGLTRYARSGKMSLLNAAFKANYNIQDFRQTGLPGEEIFVVELDPQKLKFSRGTAFPSLPIATSDKPLTIDIPVKNLESLPGRVTVIHAIAYSSDVAGFIHVEEEVPREAENMGVKIQLPEAWNGLSAHTYVYLQYLPEGADYNYYHGLISGGADFKSIASQSEYTETAYCGKVTVA